MQHGDRRRRFRRMRNACALLAALWSEAAAADGQKLTLRLSDFYPPDSPVAQYTTKKFMELVKKRSGGAIDFEYYPAEQLGKAHDMIQLTQDGVVDLGLSSPSYMSDKLPLSGVTELPALFSSACSGTLAFYKIATGNGILAQKELKPAGVRILFTTGFPPYQLLTLKKIEKAADIKGLKLRTSGSAMDVTARSLGAVPIRLTAPDSYQALSRGTVDGTIFPMASVVQYQLLDVLKYTTRGQNFGDAFVILMMSERKWNSLPLNTQKILTESGEEATRFACQAGTESEVPGMELLRNHGAQIVKFDANSEEEIRKALEPVAVGWADNLDKRGKPGTEVLRAFTDALKGVK